MIGNTKNYTPMKKQKTTNFFYIYGPFALIQNQYNVTFIKELNF